METDAKSQSWWTTLPGVLTAAGATITAVAGLIAVLHQTNILGGGRHAELSEASVAPAATEAQTTPASSATVSNAAVTPSLAKAAPGGNLVLDDVRLGDVVYQFLGLAVQQNTPDTMSAEFSVRLTNNGTRDTLFGTFRMVIDGVPREPERAPIELVASDAAKDAKVVFVVPRSARATVLRIHAYSGEKAEVPVDLARVRAGR